MKDIIDLSILEKQDREIVEKFIAIIKENGMLKGIVKELTKLI